MLLAKPPPTPNPAPTPSASPPAPATPHAPKKPKVPLYDDDWVKSLEPYCVTCKGDHKGEHKANFIRHDYPDPKLSGHYIRVSPTGAKSFMVRTLAPSKAVSQEKPANPAPDPAAFEHAMGVVSDYLQAKDADDRTALIQRLLKPLGFIAVPELNEKPVGITIGKWMAPWKIEAAREEARKIKTRVHDGKPAKEAPPDVPATFKEIGDEWHKRCAVADGYRTAPEYKRQLNCYVYPHWGDRPLPSITRKDIFALIDFVTDNHGKSMASKIYKTIRLVMTYYATKKSNDYNLPFFKGMGPKKLPSRERYLAENEIRELWKMMEAMALGKEQEPFPGMSLTNSRKAAGIVLLCLLTAQRRSKVAYMKWDEYKIERGAWDIPREDREKNNGGFLILPPVAVNIILAQQRFADSPFVFPGAKGRHIWCGWKEASEALKAKLPNFRDWVIHDLRRTARTLMAQAGVLDEHAERVMGHSVPGATINDIYNKHKYDHQKSNALARLATLIDIIANRPDLLALNPLHLIAEIDRIVKNARDNVVPLIPPVEAALYGSV
jgi:integrase